MIAHIPNELLGTMSASDMDALAPNNMTDLQVIARIGGGDEELPEWKRKRLGKITASCFGLVKKLKTTNQWGDIALGYLYDLAGEHLTGQPSETFEGSKATRWGNTYEGEAIAAYAKRTKRKVKPGKFLAHETLVWVGATPDGEVGEQGLLECKCPMNFKNHLRTVISRTVPEEYMPQVLGQLWLSGREWVDFVSYDPRIRGPHSLAIIRVKRADHLQGIKNLEERITEFHGLLLEKLEALKVKPGKLFKL